MVLGENEWIKNHEYIYCNIRLCDHHFEHLYCSVSNHLTRNAVSTNFEHLCKLLQLIFKNLLYYLYVISCNVIGYIIIIIIHLFPQTYTFMFVCKLSLR